jgi:hypothetical protein
MFWLKMQAADFGCRNRKLMKADPGLVSSKEFTGASLSADLSSCVQFRSSGTRKSF